MPSFSRASAKLAAAIRVLFDAGDASTELSVGEVWAEIERLVPRSELAAALAAVLALAPPDDAEADNAWRAELVKRFPSVRPFLPLLTEVIEFGAVEAGEVILDAVCQLPELLRRRKVSKGEVPQELVVGSWRRLVFENPDCWGIRAPSCSAEPPGSKRGRIESRSSSSPGCGWEREGSNL